MTIRFCTIAFSTIHFQEALTAELSQRPIDVRTVEKSIAAAEKDEDEREKEIAFEPIVAESNDEV
jgi:hypothetical protein